MSKWQNYAKVLRDLCAKDVYHSDKMHAVLKALYERDPWLCFDYALWCAREALQYVEPNWQNQIAALVEQVAGSRCQPTCAREASKVALDVTKTANRSGADAAGWVGGACCTTACMVQLVAITDKDGVLNAAVDVAGSVGRAADDAIDRDARSATRDAIERHQIERVLNMLEAP